MFERFTERARKVIVLAQDEAARLRHDHIGTEHLLLGLVREGEEGAPDSSDPPEPTFSVSATFRR